jgi:hypothetical protein
MRKLLLLPAFVIAGQLAFSSDASAQTACTLSKSETQFKDDRESCKKTCTDTYQKKSPKEVPGCQTACDNVLKTRLERKKDQDKAKKPDESKKADDVKKVDPPTPHAVLACPKTDVSAEQIGKIKTSCNAKCDEAKTTASSSWISACKGACDTTSHFCIDKFAAWKTKRDECTKPTKACIDACPHGNENAFNKCFNDCSNKNAGPVQEWINRAMDWPAR